MAKERVQRKLAAIVAADVVGYSRMMGRDEAGTLARLKSLRADFLHPKVAEYDGRIVKTTGDGTLIEFGSAVDAVAHAIDVQRGMADRNAGLPEEEQVWLRLGINVGDIIIDGNDIYGDGVNVAARLEMLAEPGSICISGRVHDYVGDRLDIASEDLGRQALKNIAEPIHVYRIRPGDTKATPNPGARGLLPLPSKPSVAVLPFQNMSGDSDQEYFSDGISEDIITALSRVRQIFVIARNTTFTYKGKAVDVQAVARDLGVRYVVEGSVRKAANRVRITAQLIDGDTGNHIWAERYDRVLEDIFAVQDEITENVVAALGPELTSAEIQRARRKDPSNLDAWDCTMRAMWHYARVTRQDMEEARRLALRAIEMDSGAAAAFAVLALTHVRDAINGWSESVQQSISAAYEAGRNAVVLDDRDANAQRALGWANLLQRRFEDAFSRFETAIDVDPNNASTHGSLGVALAMIGRRDEAVKHIATAMRLSPRDPFKYLWLTWRGEAEFVEEKYDEAAEWARRSLQINPDFPSGLRLLAASLGQMGRIDEARAALEQLLRLVPGQTVETVRNQFLYKAPENMERYLDGLHKAGLPE